MRQPLSSLLEALALKLNGKMKSVGRDVPEVEDFPGVWAQQVKQYPAKGTAGISYFKGELDSDRHVDCLLYRDAKGKLVGVLNHYPFDMPPYEFKGNVNVMVSPKHQGAGIGKALLKDAMKRWGVNLSQQNWTPSGNKLRASVSKELEKAFLVWDAGKGEKSGWRVQALDPEDAKDVFRKQVGGGGKLKVRALDEGRAFPVGTRRDWRRGEMEKQRDGWRRIGPRAHRELKKPADNASPMERVVAMKDEMQKASPFRANLMMMAAMMAGNKAPGMKYGSFYEAVLEESAPMPKSAKLPPEVLKQVFRDIEGVSPEPKQCYFNAQKMVLNHPDKYEYAEGFASSEKVPFPIQHGWVIFKHGGKRYLVDPTLRADHNKGFTVDNLAVGELPAGREYIGKTFPVELIRKRWEGGFAGSLYDWPPVFPLLQANPDWKLVARKGGVDWGD